MVMCLVVFFKQKTAYEMRISDWSSDVCSSDLAIVVSILRANVCGSELHVWNGKHPVKKRGGMGHEMVGEVLSLGEGVTVDNRGQALAIGDRVAFRSDKRRVGQECVSSFRSRWSLYH